MGSWQLWASKMLWILRPLLRIRGGANEDVEVLVGYLDDDEDKDEDEDEDEPKRRNLWTRLEKPLLVIAPRQDTGFHLSTSFCFFSSRQWRSQVCTFSPNCMAVLSEIREKQSNIETFWRQFVSSLEQVQWGPHLIRFDDDPLIFILFFVVQLILGTGHWLFLNGFVKALIVIYSLIAAQAMINHFWLQEGGYFRELHLAYRNGFEWRFPLRASGRMIVAHGSVFLQPCTQDGESKTKGYQLNVTWDLYPVMLIHLTQQWQVVWVAINWTLSGLKASTFVMAFLMSSPFVWILKKHLIIKLYIMMPLQCRYFLFGTCFIQE